MRACVYEFLYCARMCATEQELFKKNIKVEGKDQIKRKIGRSGWKKREKKTLVCFGDFFVLTDEIFFSIWRLFSYWIISIEAWLAQLNYGFYKHTHFCLDFSFVVLLHIDFITIDFIMFLLLLLFLIISYQVKKPLRRKDLLW